MSSGKNDAAKDARKIEIERRRRKVIDLRLQHYSTREIALQLGVSQGTVSNDLKQVRQEWAEKRSLTYEQLVDEELKRLETVEARLWDRVMTGEDDAAVDRYLKIVQERIRILGLHAPKEHKVITESAIDQEIARLTNELETLEKLDADAE